MKDFYKEYNFDESLTRIDAIWNSILPTDEIPLSDLMDSHTMSNTSATIVAIQISIIGMEINETSCEIQIKHKTAALSEIMAIFQSDSTTIDIQYNDDTIVAVMDTPKKSNIDTVLESAARINALQSVLRKKAERYSSAQINFGIGLVYGEVYFMPIIVNGKRIIHINGPAIERAKQNAKRGINQKDTVVASFSFYNNLKEDYKKFFKEDTSLKPSVYTASVINVQMNNWLNKVMQ